MADDDRPPILARQPRARWLLPVFLVALVTLSVWRLRQTPGETGLHMFAGASMGTTWSVSLVAPGLADGERREIAQAIEARIDRVDELMSTWSPDSELSRFNRSTSTSPIPLSAETLEVFRVAAEVSELTGGAFDVTVSPLVAAWGFGATDRAPGPPPPDELERARARVGYRLLELDLEGGSLRKRDAATVCDLSAVAKGFAVDEAGRALLERGHRDFLIEVGGEVLARGRRPDGARWRVAIERPDPGQRAIHRVVELEGLAMATSGDYRNYIEVDGERFSHLIDPRTGRPVASGVASVSVVEPTAARADALATGLAVLGPERGYALAEREGLAAYFLVRHGEGGLQALATPAFEPLLRDETRDAP
jgi:thiamine biosynthesis lipoprotein